MSVIPYNFPRQQLPQPHDRLSAGFIQANGRPALLTTPSKLWLAAADFSGNRNFGTLSGGVTVVPGGFGVLEQGWNFNGSTGYISIPHSAAFNFSKVTVVWVGSVTNMSGATQQRLIAKWDGSSTWILEANNQNWTFWCNNGSSTLNAQSAATSGFHVVVGTYDGANIRLYVDGVLTATTALAGSLSTNTHPIYFGTNEAANSHWMAGYTAFGDIYSSALSLSQVSSLYSCLLTGKPFPLFQPLTAAMMMGSAAAPAGGGLLLRRRRAAA